jgi:hypothetical protein
VHSSPTSSLIAYDCHRPHRRISLIITQISLDYGAVSPFVPYASIHSPWFGGRLGQTISELGPACVMLNASRTRKCPSRTCDASFAQLDMEWNRSLPKSPVRSVPRHPSPCRNSTPAKMSWLESDTSNPYPIYVFIHVMRRDRTGEQLFISTMTVP